MVQLRLMVLALCAACARGEAAPGSASGIAPPAGWRAAPELAKAASDAAGSATTASEAWAEPARGCYAVWLALHGAPAAIDAASDQLVASVQRIGAQPSAVVKPPPGDRGELSLAFVRAPYRGKLRALLAKTGDVSALACLWNEREPKACETACSSLLGGLH
jgi:hypothetical protein